MRRRWPVPLLLWPLLAGAALPAAARPLQPPEQAPTPPAPEAPLTLAEAGHLLALDARTVLLAPLRWDARGWERAGLVTLGIGAVALADRSVRDRELRDHSRTADDVARIAEPLGSQDTFAVLGGFYLGGLLSGDARARDVGFDGAVSILLAGGVVSPILKEIAGRSRPRQTAKTFDFHPFSGSASFSSGHATQAFAAASVIATSYDSKWVGAASYGVATLVGFARVHHQAHFASDVAAGAAIGTAVGRTVVLTNRRERRGHAMAIVPTRGPRDQPGFLLVASF